MLLCFFFKKLLTKPKSYFIINHVVTDAEIAQLVEHNLAKVGVASSSLVFRSMKLRPGCAAGIFYFAGQSAENFLWQRVLKFKFKGTFQGFTKNFLFDFCFFLCFACQKDNLVILYCSIVKKGAVCAPVF